MNHYANECTEYVMACTKCGKTGKRHTLVEEHLCHQMWKNFQID